MTIGDIKKEFNVMKSHKKDDLLHLFRPAQEHWYSPIAFFGSIKKVGNKFQFKENEPTSKLNIIIEQIKEFNSKLFRPVHYHNPLYREGYNDLFIIQDELEKVGIKRMISTYEYPCDDIWELKTQVFSSIFSIKFSIKRRDDSRIFTVSYCTSKGYFTPIYTADCYGAESVLYLINKIKTYVIQETIKQLVALYDKQLVVDESQIEIKNEGIYAVDIKFRLWIDNKSWDEMTKEGSIYDTKDLKPVAYFSRLQSFMVASDIYNKPNNEGLLKIE